MAGEAVREVDVSEQAARLPDFVGRTQDELITHLEVVTSAEPAHMIDKLLNQVASAWIAGADHRDRRNRNARESDFEDAADIREDPAQDLAVPAFRPIVCR